MTVFARDVDTGMAKWAYQMTPYDEWDFDGSNEWSWPISTSRATDERGAFRPQ
jgi:glucose dehydrogenase